MAQGPLTHTFAADDPQSLGTAPAIALRDLYRQIVAAAANAAQNANAAQQQGFITAQAATTMGVATLYSLDTASAGAAAGGTQQGSRPSAPRRRGA